MNLAWHNTQLGRIAFAAAIGLTVSSITLADTELWAQIAAEDVAAARRHIQENHPAAVPEHGDTQFQRALHDGYARANDLASRVRTYEGYRAVLARFAAGFGDRHISSDATLMGPKQWPGFLVSLDTHWRVSVSALDEGPPTQSLLLACDGQTPDELARSILQPLTSNWNIAAQRKRISVRLFVDEGDPFVTRPARCTFELPSGERFDHVLQWQPIEREALALHLKIAEARPKRDVSLTQFAGGSWIRLGTLGDAARPLVEEIARRAQELRKRPIVLDLRGNGGGSSIYSERIAEALYGKVRVAETQARTAAGPDTHQWRASAGNLRTLEQYIERFTRELGESDPLIEELKRLRISLERALRNGQAFGGVAAQEAPPRAPDAPGAEAEAPFVMLFTDRFCFSSCLLAARLFRNLGAMHVGEETDQNTHYTEVRELTLPSGLSTFWTMQAFNTSLPKRVGPFTPVKIYPGPLNDDAAVKAWVIEAGKLANWSTGQ